MRVGEERRKGILNIAKEEEERSKRSGKGEKCRRRNG